MTMNNILTSGGLTKVKNIDTSEFVLKTKCDTDKSDLEKRN